MEGGGAPRCRAGLLAGKRRDPSANPASQYSSEESAEPGNGFWMPPNLTGIIYAIFVTDLLLTYLKASSWFTPTVRA